MAPQETAAPAGQGPTRETLIPRRPATDSFQYVTPSQPHTGLFADVSVMPIGTHFPLAQVLLEQYLPGPQVFDVADQTQSAPASPLASAPASSAPPSGMGSGHR